MATRYQYIGDGHTQVRLSPAGEKVKVGHGEIVENQGQPEKYFTQNNFREYVGDAPSVVAAGTGEGSNAAGPANSAPANRFNEFSDLTVAMLKEIAAERKIDVSGARNKQDTLDILVPQLKPEEIAQYIADANAEK